MELKLKSDGMDLINLDLLIVPYGIETTFTQLEELKDFYLLIVPYGIETQDLLQPFYYRPSF